MTASERPNPLLARNRKNVSNPVRMSPKSLAAAFLLGSLVLSHAQVPGGDPKKRMLFQIGETVPEPGSASPVPTPAAAKTAAPPDAIRTFFAALKSGQVDAAYETLAKGTIISERAENVKELKARTSQALDSYGPVAGYETLSILNAGENLVRYTCISLNQDLPLRWRFYFYRSAAGWKLVDLRVDDGLVELFEEVAKDQKRPSAQEPTGPH